MAASSAANLSAPGKFFCISLAVGSQSPLRSIARHPLPCGVTSEGPTLTHSFMRPAVGVARSTWPGPYFLRARKDAQNPRDLPAKSFSSSPRSIPPDYEEVMKLDVLIEHPWGQPASQRPFFSSHAKLTSGKKQAVSHFP